jgi:hypothetical protein
MMSNEIKHDSQNVPKQVPENTQKNQNAGLSTGRLMGSLRLNLTQPECSGPSV